MRFAVRVNGRKARAILAFEGRPPSHFGLIYSPQPSSTHLHVTHVYLPPSIVALRLGLRDTFSCLSATPWLCCAAIVEEEQEYSLPVWQLARALRKLRLCEFDKHTATSTTSLHLCVDSHCLSPPLSRTPRDCPVTNYTAPVISAKFCSRVTLTASSS